MQMPTLSTIRSYKSERKQNVYLMWQLNQKRSRQYFMCECDLNAKRINQFSKDTNLQKLQKNQRDKTKQLKGVIDSQYKINQQNLLQSKDQARIIPNLIIKIFQQIANY
ncbi:hypothetical protein TTHERM_00713540 (macronuclear) [Tetrahymena thermophila SB210]|uniref:Uncharacterized protein n=1 Tax=Tetrahymena thermophila (strain SB210) TaxID=312017 RepID=Q24CU8_TETTS|nr:hypothetical protein TTHERM_00713540 [Tetrahymena thermophila SB210]EAS05660.2 hypothetical protein TTHERM_00713540 [Tetrahymena thermophila SB210]|eukprot:XP_001025905.2 hypothetical protein TTHERM_00713540 [Tetrahymena thermophila SB210]